MPSAADTTLPRDGVTRGGKSGRRSGARAEGSKPPTPSIGLLPRQ